MRRAAVNTGISRSTVMISASKSRVNCEPSRVQGTGNLMHPDLRALHTGYAGVEIGFMRKEFHASPCHAVMLSCCHVSCVMYCALLTTGGASKAANPGKIDVQIHAFLLHGESYMLYQPRRNQSEFQRKIGLLEPSFTSC